MTTPSDMQTTLSAISTQNIQSILYYELRYPPHKSFIQTLFSIKDPDLADYGAYPPHIEIYYHNNPKPINIVFKSDASAIDFYNKLLQASNLMQTP